MGFRPFSYAPYLYCWADMDCVKVQELNGTISSYACALGFCTEKQLIPFTGSRAMWCLQHEELLFVGRYDGTFSGFRPKDHLVVRYGPWKCPFYRGWVLVGQCDGKLAYLDTLDHRTIYLQDDVRAFVLHDPLPDGAQVPAAYSDAMQKVPQLTVYMKGGLLDVEALGVWTSAPTRARRDRALQL